MCFFTKFVNEKYKIWVIIWLFKNDNLNVNFKLYGDFWKKKKCAHLTHNYDSWVLPRPNLFYSISELEHNWKMPLNMLTGPKNLATEYYALLLRGSAP